jgi:hypothetical protein
MNASILQSRLADNYVTKNFIYLLKCMKTHIRNMQDEADCCKFEGNQQNEYCHHLRWASL